jgi:hypothetical protein
MAETLGLLRDQVVTEPHIGHATNCGAKPPARFLIDLHERRRCFGAQGAGDSAQVPADAPFPQSCKWRGAGMSDRQQNRHQDRQVSDETNQSSDGVHAIS